MTAAHALVAIEHACIHPSGHDTFLHHQHPPCAQGAWMQ